MAGAQAADAGNETLWEFAGELGSSWKPIARYLGCREALLQNLTSDHPANAHERAYQMLLRCRKNSPCDQSEFGRQLRQACQNAERRDLLSYLTNFPGQNRDLDRGTFISRLKGFVRRKMNKLPLIPWISTGCVHVDQVFTNVQLLVNVATAYLPVRLPLKSHDAIFKDLSEEEDGFTDLSSTRILMRGRTGSGKTTLLTKYAYDWCMGKRGTLLCDVPVVFILPMRKLDHSSNLGQAVLDHMLSSEKKITAAAIEQFCSDYPDDVVILLDGYDEFKGKGLDEDECGNIVKMLRGECFENCRVVVTTRPSRVGDFENDYESYRHLEITGFTSENIDEYVYKVFKGEHRSLGEKLLIYLEENQLKEELASIPLMLTAFCQLAKWTNGKDFGELNTVSKLFDRLIECVLRHEDSKTDQRSTSSDVPFLRNLSGSLTSEELVLELGKVALEGFLGNDAEELIFSEDDFSRCSDKVLVIEQGLRAGFLCRDEDSSIRPQSYEDLGMKRQKLSPKRNISFILKSLQEKCAGSYLAHLLEGGESDTRAFTAYLQRVNSAQRVLDLTNILVFACAASKEAAHRILSHVIRILTAQQGENISQYLKGKLHFKECQKTQRLIETCLQLNFESNGEGQFNQLFNTLFGEGCCIRLVGISSYVAKALGYLFTHSYQRSSGQELSVASSVDDGKPVLSVRSLQLINIRLESSTQFREFLNCYPGAEEQISSFMGDSVESKPRNSNPAKLREQFLSSGQKIPGYLNSREETTFLAVLPLWQEVSQRRMRDFGLGLALRGLEQSSLHELVFNGVNADKDDWSRLFGMIRSGVFGELTKLTLSLNDLLFNQTSELAAALVSTPQLRYLKMAGNEVGEGFIGNLPQLPRLENVILDKSNLSSPAIVEFVKKFELYPRLQKLDLRRNEDMDDTAVHSVCEGLSGQQDWKELRISLYKVTDDGLEFFQSRAGHAAGLTHLNLVHTPIPDRVVHYCAAALTSLPHLVDLRISGIPSANHGAIKTDPQEDSLCKSETVAEFTAEVEKLEHLRFLSLLYTKMTPEAFLKMLDCLGGHTSLKTFRFSRPYLPSRADVERACKKAEEKFLQLWV